MDTTDGRSSGDAGPAHLDVAIDIDALTRALDVHSLRILVAIDQTGSISAAARSLGYTQPTITQHVQRLEARLGASLVARTARAAHLTPIGALLAAHAPRIDASLTAAATELARLLGHRADTVRLAAPAALIGAALAPALGALLEERPDIAVSVLEASDGADAIAMVRDGRADVAVTSDVVLRDGRTPVPRRRGLRSTFLFAEEIVALTTADVPAAGARVDAAALAGSPWVLGGGTSSDAVAQIIGRARSAHDLDVSLPSAAIALAAHGIATAFVPEGDLAGTVSTAPTRMLGLSPAVTRRTTATTLVEAAAIPAVAEAVRQLTAHRPSPADVEAIVDARRRSAGHRARFLSVPQHPSRIPHPPEENDTMLSSPTTRLATAGAAAAASIIMLSACTTGASPAPGKSAGVDTGAEIDTVTVALPGSLSNLYVGQESGILNYYIASITQEGLVSIDAQGRVQPGLAESWTQPDDVTYVYELRDDARFQDGTPVTADDVVFSLQEARDATASPGLTYYLSGVEDIEKTGDSEVTVTLTAPDPAFLANMSSGGAAFITSKKFWEDNGGKVGTPSSLLLGSGPYQVTEFVPDSHVTLERVDTWWGGVPKAKEITVSFIPDESTRLLAAQSGDIDVAFNVPLAQSAQWEKLDTMRVDYVNDLSYVGLYFNTHVAPFDDPKVREAIAHAVDRDAYVSSLLRGHGEAATAIMTPESLGKVYDATQAREKLAGIPQWDYDMDAAAKALAASGSPKGFEAELLTPSTGPQLGSAAQALAQNLAAIGITLNVREVPIEEWLASLDASNDHGINLMWYFSTLGDPAEVPSYLLGAGNPAGYDDPEVTALLARAGSTADPAERIDLLIQAETLQAKAAVNVPLWWGQSATAFANDLGMKDYSSFAFISSWPTQLYRAAK